MQDFLGAQVGGVPVDQILIALGTAVVATFGLRFAFGLALRRFRTLARRTENDIDDLVVELLEKTRLLFIGLIALWAAARPLDLPAEAETVLRGVLVIGLHLQAGFWGMGVINYLITRWKRQQLEEDPGVATAVGVVGFMSRMGLWAVLGLTALGTLGVEVSPFVASLGIGGVAVALALQNVLGDLFASMSIVFDKPFVIGDFVSVDDLSGTVEYVGLKTTRVRSLSGEQLVFSNSDLLGSRVRNYGRMRERRVAFAIGVTYGTPAAVLRAIPGYVREAVEALDNTRFDRSHLKGFGDSSIDFETVYYMSVPDYTAFMDTQEQINLALYERFEDEGIDFAFPTRTVHVVGSGADGEVGVAVSEGSPTSADASPPGADASPPGE
ncbi:mechanosensitive ion channel family protein [Gaopeijia maritima]|uniref:Mechanosensitive ion channel family protein n=1 Tax=Gaopeijia maritima TaxID=3119007 RepID=A0ABU9E959_9BACT